MKAYLMAPTSSGPAFELHETQRPSPRPGQVLVRVRASALNRGELLSQGGRLAAGQVAKPTRAGVDFAGEIVEVSPDVEGWTVGDQVMGRAPGAYADYVAAGVGQLLPAPRGLSVVEAAAIPNVFVTAHDAVVSAAAIGPADTVLVTAASSGVGTAAIQLSRLLGAARVVATSRSPAKADALRRLGADVVLDPSADDIDKQVAAATEGRGVDAIIDCVGGPMLPLNLRALAVCGRLVSVGRNGGTVGDCDLDLLALKRARLLGVTFRTRSAAEADACVQRFAADCLDAFGDGRLRGVVDRVFPFAALAEAHRYMLSDALLGKVVLAHEPHV